MDSWLISRRDYFRDIYLEEAHKKGIQSEQASEQATAKAEHMVTTIKNRVQIIYDNIEKTSADVSKYSYKISDISQQMVNPKLSPQEVAELKPHLDYYTIMQKGALQKQDQYAKELQDLINSNDPETFKSDFSEFFINLVDICRDYISILSSEQMVILFNLSGYTILIMIFTSITTILIGQDLINYFQLEFKYPKLAKYIKFQLTLRKYYLRFYIVYFYFSILILISLNIFMFSYDYFYM